MKSSDIRQAFFDYFTANGHELVESSSLVPNNDPTLLFTNAGMVQFKDNFLGLDTRYQRAVSAQRCVRAGGKHNDLENVGYTARHHTFFEMLGNFSFGDYFKRDAIHFAWGFLTKVLKLPVEKLWVTVYQDDDEAADIWINDIGVSAKRLSRCGDADNFWSMGDTGPCGPCTEIFYDHGPEIAGGPPGSPDADGDRYIEIWNLVFMQFNRDNHGHLHPLPKPSVDTGMGLERIAAVVQHVHNNYDIDSFQYLITAILALAPKPIDASHPSLKVIADHIRACGFLIADGVTPGNEGRGYVLRRIIRRAVRHGNKLGLPVPFFSQLVKPLVIVMKEAFAGLVDAEAHIIEVLRQEENQFAKTLDQGLRLLQEQLQGLKGTEIPGDIAFKLYDTFGFPLDLTEDIAREKNLSVDVAAFHQCMQQQRELSQAASQFSVDYSAPGLLTETSVFHGYHAEQMNSRILAILCDGQKTEQLVAGMKGVIILDQSPFYAESGGQVGDKGYLLAENTLFIVDDTQKIGQAIAHFGQLTQGTLSIQQTIEAKIDSERRAAIRLNHTATHLVHAALKQVVGPNIQQKGSLVDAERARFDFSHHEALSPEQLLEVEALVNARIRANDEVLTHLMTLEDAKASGAMALFGEKYSDDVRVLSIGEFSKELCGGTHAARTGDIALFKIISEYGVASGIRRIEIMTGRYAYEWVNQQLAMFDDMALKLKTTRDNAPDKLTRLLQDSRQQEKELSRMQMALAAKSGNDLLANIEQIAGINVLIKALDNADSHTLRTTLDQLKSRVDDAVIVLFSIDADKMSVVAGVSKSLLGKVPSAGHYVKQLCGKGGGRDDMAQGGGVVPDNLSEKIAEIKAMIMSSIV